MKRLNDPRLQRILSTVAMDPALSSPAAATLTSDLMALDAELTALRASQATAAKPKAAK